MHSFDYHTKSDFTTNTNIHDLANHTTNYSYNTTIQSQNRNTLIEDIKTMTWIQAFINRVDIESDHQVNYKIDIRECGIFRRRVRRLNPRHWGFHWMLNSARRVPAAAWQAADCYETILSKRNAAIQRRLALRRLTV